MGQVTELSHHKQIPSETVKKNTIGEAEVLAYGFPI